MIRVLRISALKKEDGKMFCFMNEQECASKKIEFSDKEKFTEFRRELRESLNVKKLFFHYQES